MARKKEFTIHVDIYEDERETIEGIQFLEKYTGIKSKADLTRWNVNELTRRLKHEIVIQEKTSKEYEKQLREELKEELEKEIREKIKQELLEASQ